MPFIKRKTALFSLLAVYTGFLLIHTAPAVRTGVLLASSCTLLFSCFRFPDPIRRHSSLLRLTAAALCFGALLPILYTDLYAAGKIRKMENRNVSITAVVSSMDYATAYSAAYTVKLQSADDLPMRGRVLLETSALSLQTGDVIQADVSFSQPEEYSGTFPQRRYYLSRGIFLVASCDTVTIDAHTSAGISGFFQSIRQTLIAQLQVLLGQEDAALPIALFLGDRSTLVCTLERDFRRLGISHLLAISGLHFVLLFGILDRLLSNLIHFKKLRLLFLSLFAISYMFLCGMSASVLRAGVMLLFSYTASLLDRQSDTSTALGVSSLFLCIIQPSILYDVGFQLSVTAVLGILCFSHIYRVLAIPHMGKRFLYLSRIGKSLFLSFTVQIILLPLLWFYFGELSPWAPVMTLLFSPLIELILLLTPVLLVSQSVPILSGILCAVLTFLTRITENAASLCTQLPCAVLSLRHPLIPVLCILGTLLLIAAFPSEKRKTVGILLTGCLCLYASVFITAGISDLRLAGQVRIISTVYGKNDALILRTNRKAMLCDFSDGSYSALNTAMSEAQADGVMELDALLLTHLHKRHIQSVARMCDTYFIDTLLLPEAISETDRTVCAALTRAAEERGISCITYQRNGLSSIQFSTLSLSVSGEFLARSTHPVISLLITGEEHRLLYLGASWQEAALPSSITNTADILLFGAHGPIYKTEFAPEISPSLQYLLFRGDSLSFASPDFLRRLPEQTAKQSNRTVLILLES